MLKGHHVTSQPSRRESMLLTANLTEKEAIGVKRSRAAIHEGFTDAPSAAAADHGNFHPLLKGGRPLVQLGVLVPCQSLIPNM
ncbi:hypothetical protein OUZ56_007331 [Daphnia magna]|uniref:Uncharacterized protein n=1 Tax=Daphnia magna TaxID=35525 RepID=A0ABQ9YYD1_9CRUS|nr:hypothetical protein OUZ56_007331 [Daphnia magna]